MIPVFKPSYGPEEVEAVARVLESGWTGLGPEVEKFEDEFAEYIGTRYAVATNSCTAALHLAIECLPTDSLEYVITTPITFVSTNHAILWGGKKPYFCDVEPDTLNIDPDKIPAEALEKACAIMCVHFGGHACDMVKLEKLADEYNLQIIEDAAHGCGGKHYWRRLGSIGNMGCFSFHAVKNLSCGSGGMLTTNDKDVYGKARSLRWLGVDRSTWDRSINTYTWEYDITGLGLNYYMNDISAAIGRVQLAKLDKANALRKRLADRYTVAFSMDDTIELPASKSYADSSWHNYVIKVPNRAWLHKRLEAVGVGSSVHYKPNTLYSTYLGSAGECPVAMDVWKKLLTLPLYPDLAQSDQDHIIDSVLKCVEE
jgi:perosamine synthetase